MPCCWGSIVAPQAYVMLNMVTPDHSYVLDPPGPAETVMPGPVRWTAYDTPGEQLRPTLTPYRDDRGNVQHHLPVPGVEVV